MEKPRDVDSRGLSIALGGGGTFGIGLEAGYLDAFKEHGADFSDSHMVGTSAGAWVASFAATGKTYDEVTNKIKNIKVPNKAPGYLQEIARDIFGNERAANVSGMAVKLPSRENKFGKVTQLNGDEYDLADIVAASSSVPLLFAPARIENDLYWDGGVRSMASAHMAPRSRRLLAIAALGGDLHFNTGPVRLTVGRVLDKWFHYEMGKWKKEHDGEVIFIRPNHAINELVQGLRDCFSVEVGKRAYDLARIHAEELIQTRESIYNFVHEADRPTA